MPQTTSNIKWALIYIIGGIIGLFFGANILGIYIGGYIYEHTGPPYRQFGNEFAGGEYIFYGAIAGVILSSIVIYIVKSKLHRRKNNN